MRDVSNVSRSSRRSPSDVNMWSLTNKHIDLELEDSSPHVNVAMHWHGRSSQLLFQGTGSEVFRNAIFAILKKGGTTRNKQAHQCSIKKAPKKNFALKYRPCAGSPNMVDSWLVFFAQRWLANLWKLACHIFKCEVKCGVHFLQYSFGAVFC